MISPGKIRCAYCKSQLVAPVAQKEEGLFSFTCKCGREYFAFENLIFLEKCPRSLINGAIRLVSKASNLTDLYNRILAEGEIHLTMLPMDIKTMLYHRPLGIRMLYRYWIKEELKEKRPSFLDIGMGTGHLILELLSDGATEAFGTDSNPMALFITKKLLEDSRVTQPYTLVNCDARFPLPFEDDFFDAIFTIHTFHYLDYKSQQDLIEEMIRITKTGGKIFILGHSNKIYPHESVGGIGTRGRLFVHLVPRPLLSLVLGFEYPIYSLSPQGLARLFQGHPCEVFSEKEISQKLPEEALEEYENQILDKFSEKWLEFSYPSRGSRLQKEKVAEGAFSKFSRLLSPRLYLVAEVRK